jgi:hypothetical protein
MTPGGAGAVWVPVGTTLALGLRDFLLCPRPVPVHPIGGGAPGPVRRVPGCPSGSAPSTAMTGVDGHDPSWHDEAVVGSGGLARQIATAEASIRGVGDRLMKAVGERTGEKATGASVRRFVAREESTPAEPTFRSWLGIGNSRLSAPGPRDTSSATSAREPWPN